MLDISETCRGGRLSRRTVRAIAQRGNYLVINSTMDCGYDPVEGAHVETSHCSISQQAEEEEVGQQCSCSRGQREGIQETGICVSNTDGW